MDLIFDGLDRTALEALPASENLKPTEAKATNQQINIYKALITMLLLQPFRKCYDYNQQKAKSSEDHVYCTRILY